MIYTVSDLVEYYIDRKMLAPITARNYRKIATRFERLATPRLDLIDEELCLAWRNRVLKDASAETYNSYLRSLRAIFGYGLSKGVISHNPFSHLCFHPNNIRRPKCISDSVYKQAVRYLQSHDNPAPAWFWLIVVKFQATTGVRARQVTNIQWRDLDFDNMVIRLRVSGSKTRREWEIPLSESMAESLNELRSRAGVAAGPNNQVFNVTLFNPRYKGSVMTVPHVNGFYRRLSEKIGHKISSRRLRHTLATRLANVQSPDLFAIQELLGHTDIRTTRMYVKTDVERIRALLVQAGVV